MRKTLEELVREKSFQGKNILGFETRDGQYVMTFNEFGTGIELFSADKDGNLVPWSKEPFDPWSGRFEIRTGHPLYGLVIWISDGKGHYFMGNPISRWCGRGFYLPIEIARPGTLFDPGKADQRSQTT